MQRKLAPYILRDLPTKIILLTGPRQSGKTTLSKDLSHSFDYLNVDVSEDVMIIKEKKMGSSQRTYYL